MTPNHCNVVQMQRCSNALVGIILQAVVSACHVLSLRIRGQDVLLQMDIDTCTLPLDAPPSVLMPRVHGAWAMHKDSSNVGVMCVVCFACLGSSFLGTEGACMVSLYLAAGRQSTAGLVDCTAKRPILVPRCKGTVPHTNTAVPPAVALTKRSEFVCLVPANRR